MSSSDPKNGLSRAEREALLAISSQGPRAAVDVQALASLVNSGFVEVNNVRRVVLTIRGRSVVREHMKARKRMDQ